MKQRRLEDSDARVTLHTTKDEPDSVHLFDEDARLAVNAALAANRPLLVRGEPGVGKSQLARAAAKALQRHFVQHTLTRRAEVEDLFWTFDAVRRLAEAQLLSAVFGRADMKPDALEKTLEERLVMKRFVEPGPLWWAFNWESAHTQLLTARPQLSDADRPDDSAPQGVVVLLDEIDKADSALPNGLLEALGLREFATPDGARIRQRMDRPAPLVVVTTNEERILPNAFLRRCLILNVHLPDDDDALTDLLVKRAEAHFNEKTMAAPAPSPQLLERAVRLLIDHRKSCTTPPKPGQAEYLDLVRAVCYLADADAERRKLLETVAPLSVGKFRSARSSAVMTRPPMGTE